jgi:hypothetical protein
MRYGLRFLEFLSASMIRAILALMAEAVRISETSVNFYQTTGCCNPEDSHLLSTVNE